MFGFDSAHTHQNPYEKVINKTNVSRLKPVWSYATGSYISSSPAVANGLLYVGSRDGKLYAFGISRRSNTSVNVGTVMAEYGTSYLFVRIALHAMRIYGICWIHR
jgi:hypothetical protein